MFPALSSTLQDRSVVVFGGTSGIGLAAARQAKAAGAAVIVVGRDSAGAERVATEDGFAGWRAADVTRPDAVAAALADIPRVDHLALLAGTFVAGKIREAEVDHLKRAFDERIWAAVHALRALGDRLAGDGSVTLISGALADRPSAQGTAVLAAASAAMEAFARGLALELAPVRVNALSPGTTDTPLLARTLGAHRDAYVAGLTERLPQRRLGTAEEAGAAVVFLMGNGFMNGETLHIDGGGRLI
ncbi:MULTISPECIES: SDR family oxidoreductase [Methylobacterium]|uniref:SDR family oxidoreductase n=1 Tax=Methylobacterium TaxID=407 RepID=UPI000D5C697A|nr:MULTISPECIES: SDR family oxidoreductase [Methylobacterium]MDE3745190.1 SDR family oxidoreductase [Methylobacterium radiotolerans]PVY86079.1 NAD(P)-dependent dehydrogenase (short-subunit alcohol dehydrogenase family) [Methylobacterium organophilum]RUP21836.1 MAG: SDR family oxidoreductase [Methylobacterium sp.]